MDGAQQRGWALSWVTAGRAATRGRQSPLARGALSLLVLVASSVVTACATGTEPRDGVEARQAADGSWMLVRAMGDGSSAGYPEAALEGALVLDASTGCVAGRLGDALIGVILPDTAALTGDAVELSPGGTVIELDAPETIGGGFQSREDIESRGATVEPCAYAEYFTINPDL
ncbi:hypothetical protein D8Y24_05705 [Agrococcus lahaulensis]|nr:hypothetical protein D8Y24_05705 [Agrococcus lahaulensis]